MKHIFKEVGKEFKLSEKEVKKMWEFQFKFVMDTAKENVLNEYGPKIRLEGFGTFKPNTNQIIKYKEKKEDYDNGKSKTSRIT